VFAAIARWVLYLAMAAVVGGVSTAVLLRSGASPGAAQEGAWRQAQQVARRVWLGGVVLLLVVTLVRAWMQVDAFRDAGDSFWSMAPSVLGSTSWGRGLQLQLLGVVVSMFAARPADGGWRPGAFAYIGGLLLVAAPAWQGHAASVDPHLGWSMLADTLHTLAFATWIGTLLSIWWAFLRGRLIEAPDDDRDATLRALVDRFSPVALSCGATLVVTGSVAAWLHLTDLNDLWTTNWGRLLLAKLLAVGAVAAGGAYNWRVVTPQLGTTRGARLLRIGARNELLLATIVLILTSILTGTGTPGSD